MRVFPLVILFSLAGCNPLDFLHPAPPAVAYVTVGTYGGSCGYEWNRGAMLLNNPKTFKKAIEWDGGKEAALLFRFEPVATECVEKARLWLKKAGFQRVWLIETPKTVGFSGPLLPNRH